MIDISFITSCYNSEEFLDGLIENLLRQSHENFEHIIVDSASTDNSVTIVRKWMERDPRIKLIEQPERTPYGVSWLTGWQQAQGKVVCNSNSDDRSYPWRGTKVMQAYNWMSMLRWVKPRFYYGGYETKVDGVTIARGYPPQYTEMDMQRFFRCGVHVHWDNQLRGMADWDVMFRAGNEYRSAFDYWLVLYFISLGATGEALKSIFSIYHQRPDSLEQSDKKRSGFEALRAISSFYPVGVAINDLESKTRVESPEFYKRYKEFLHEFGE